MAKIETLYFVHHSHTDVGYTHDQPIVLDLHERFISTALELAECYASSDSDGAFRWTVENTYVLSRWLKHASPAQIDRFLAMEKAGRIEVTGMFANITLLLDCDELIESFQSAAPCAATCWKMSSARCRLRTAPFNSRSSRARWQPC